MYDSQLGFTVIINNPVIAMKYVQIRSSRSHAAVWHLPGMHVESLLVWDFFCIKQSSL